jgi:hypothetical protein
MAAIATKSMIALGAQMAKGRPITIRSKGGR